MRIPRFLLALVLATSGWGAIAPVARADSAAVVVNTHDGLDMFRLVFQIRRVGGDVVDEANLAAAVSSCTSCQSVAIAIQVVLVTSDPSVVTPTNTALAINIECTLCDTLAIAYQFVLGVDKAVHFTPDGYRELAAIRKALHDLRGVDLSSAEIDAQVSALMDRLAVVLQNELVSGPPQPPAADASSSSSPESSAPDSTPTESSGSTSPSESASAEPTSSVSP
ncbi:MAG: hypothetical protein ABR520_09390 [Mycobacteriales bacterium]|nr:hypothetical protein [Frankia sp.]